MQKNVFSCCCCSIQPPLTFVVICCCAEQNTWTPLIAKYIQKHTHTHTTWWKPQKCHSNSLNFSVKQFSDCELLPNIRPSTFDNHGANQHTTVFDWIMSCFFCSWSCFETLKSVLHYFCLFCTLFVSHNIVAKNKILPISKSYKAIPQICKSNMNCEYEICR